jgi:type IV pilus assembly protein PilW
MVVPTTTTSLAALAIGPFGTSANPLQLVSASGFSSGSIISIGGVISASLGTQAGNTFTLGSTIAAPVTFPPGTLVSLLQCVTYQVMQTGGANTAAICGPNVPCLARGIAAPLIAGQIDCNGAGGATACTSIAEGIEDVQLAYACDGCNLAVNGGLADLVVDDQGPINNIFDAIDFIPNSTFTTSPPSSDTIRLVRVTVVAREAQNEQGFGEGTVAQANTAGPVIVEDHNPSAPGDPGYVAATYRQSRRRIITRTVEVRNIGL